jgi:hypothetical protein
MEALVSEPPPRHRCSPPRYRPRAEWTKVPPPLGFMKPVGHRDNDCCGHRHVRHHSSKGNEVMTRVWEPSDISPQQTEHATQLRVPILDTFNPGWSYITGIVVQDLEHPEWPNRGQIPTEAEVELVAQRLQEYCAKLYRQSYLNRMREFAPYDIDSTCMVYFIKWDNGGWGYRRSTWDRGPLFVPTFEAEPESLAQVIDRTR